MFVLGIVIGTTIGMLLVILCVASAEADRKDNK